MEEIGVGETQVWLPMGMSSGCGSGCGKHWRMFEGGKDKNKKKVPS